MMDWMIETYKWVTESFLECMKGVMLKTVVIDGDLAIYAAISKLLIDVDHRLYGWHIHQNGMKKVPKKGFCRKLNNLIY